MRTYHDIPEEATVKIYGLIKCRQLRDDRHFVPGDLVLDVGDISYGIVDYVDYQGRVAVRDKWVVEVGIHPDRLIKIEPMFNLN